MGTPSTELIAVHLAVLADTAGAGTEQLCGVLAYDGHGRRHLHALTASTPPVLLRELVEPDGPCPLQLPLWVETPEASAGGRTWRSWVLPTIPTSLRALPAQLLAAAVAEQLTSPPAGRTTDEVGP